MQHIFNIAIDVEDEKIVKAIEKNAETKVIELITNKAMDRICKKDYYGGVANYDRLDDMIKSLVGDVIQEHKELIIDKTAAILADKIARSKAGKEILSRFEEEKDND